jgi:hypothetical protein
MAKLLESAGPEVTLRNLEVWDYVDLVAEPKSAANSILSFTIGSRLLSHRMLPDFTIAKCT